MSMTDIQFVCEILIRLNNIANYWIASRKKKWPKFVFIYTRNSIRETPAEKELQDIKIVKLNRVKCIPFYQQLSSELSE